MNEGANGVRRCDFRSRQSRSAFGPFDSPLRTIHPKVRPGTEPIPFIHALREPINPATEQTLRCGPVAAMVTDDVAADVWFSEHGEERAALVRLLRVIGRLFVL